MRRTLSTLCLSMLVAVSGYAQTTDEIIAKNLKAKGGAEKLKAMKTVKATGKMTMGPIEAPFVITKKRPGMVRMDFTVQGMTGTQAYDGSTGWMVMPFMGKNTPEKMSDDMLKDILDEADFDGPLVDYASKGHKLEFLGKEEIEGTPAYKLKMTRKNGDENIIYIDTESDLEIKQVGKRKIQGQDVEIETTIGDYKEVNGFVMPFSISSKMKGGPGMGQSITIDKVEIDADVDSNIFRMPAAEPKKEETKKN